MMFSKLSGRSIATHVPSVTRPASVSGASVSSDVGRAPQRDRQQDRDREQRPQARLQERLDDRAARFLDAHRGARGFGRDLPDRGGEALQRRVVVGIALGKHLDARAAVRRHPVALQVRGQRLQRDRFGLQRGAQLVERHDEPRDQRVARALARRRDPPWRESSAPCASRAASVAATPAGCGPAACSSACRGAQHRAHDLLVVGRRLHVERIERGVEQHRRVGQQRELRLPAVRE